MDRISLLKVDKDCFVSRDWLHGYVQTTLLICKVHDVAVTCIRMCASQRKGLHFYIGIYPSVEAGFANYLQWLLGDDCQRVDFNRARIESGLNDWSKLFEVAGRRLRTIYTDRAG